MNRHKRNLPYRKPLRLKGWDYRNPGLYYVTINTKNHQPFFGEVRDGIMGFSVPGALANYYWTKIMDQFPSVILDAYQIMPNHIHGIIGITETPDDQNVGPSIHDGQARECDSVSDAMNRVPTNSESTQKPPAVGSSIHRDPANSPAPDPDLSKTSSGSLNSTQNKSKGGITKESNPMLYKTHLGKIIRWFKGRCTYEIRDRNYPEFAWQSKFYDHIIRNEKSLQNIRQYIVDNPLRWEIDRENPDRVHEKAVEYMIGKNNE